MHQINLQQTANLGNRMIQYAFAVHLSRLIPPCEITGVSLPEWGLTTPPPQPRTFDAHFLVTDFDQRPLETLLAQIRLTRAAHIKLEGFFQNLDLLPDPGHASRVLFPKSGKFDGKFSATDLVINIRAGEILNGIEWYPLVPPSFYRDLVETTGLSPIFVGQVGQNPYSDEIRNLFPHAEYISTGNPMDDFELVRAAKNICIAVSTFSWLAAWLSDAQQIIYPLLGFLHPSLTSCYAQKIAPTNLAPHHDRRYRFFLFPLIYGLAYQQMRHHHPRIEKTWREIPPSQVRALRGRALAPAPAPAPAPSEARFERIWYAHNHLDAAMDIAEGKYASPLHHYLATGRTSGLSPAPPITLPTTPLISRGKTATQSSISPWSTGKSPHEDAAGALDGDIEKEYGFHTDYDPNPWWLCDLGEVFEIELINIYNRRSISDIRTRALPLLAAISTDGASYEIIHRCEPGDDFGETGPALRPHQIIPPTPIPARYLKLTVDGRTTCLHLAQVQIFGQRPGTSQHRLT